MKLFLLLIISIFHCQSCLGKTIEEKLYNATVRILSSMLPPLCSKIFFNENNIQSKYISSKGFSGRILPIGTFPTVDLALDYFYGSLCPIAMLKQRRKHAEGFDLVRISYERDAFIVHCEFIHYLTNNTRVSVLAQIAFDEQYKICGFDGQIRNAGLAFNFPTDAIRYGAIIHLCDMTQTICTGASQQYTSVNVCKQYLTTQIPFGSFDEADQGNVVCRLVHAKFIPLNPLRYCPRVGPNGGNICTDKCLDVYHNQTNFLACAHKYY